MGGKMSMMEMSPKIEHHHPLDNQGNSTPKKHLKMKREDLISCLPDDLLCHIISLLPFETAAHTNILSRRWKDLWKKAFELNGTIEDAVATILSLLGHPRRRNKWGFQFNFGKGRVLFAAIAPNHTLYIDFSDGEGELPRTTFNWFLPLNCPRKIWPSTYKDDEVLELRSPARLFQIKALHLISVSHHFSKLLTSMVSKFPFLESLTVAKCDGVRYLDIKSNTNLRRLTVMDCPQLEYFYFEGLCLRSFRYRGRLVSFQFNFSCTHVRSLRNYPPYLFGDGDVMLDFREGHLNEWRWVFDRSRSSHCCDLKCFKSTLLAIHGVKSLTICRWFFEKLFCHEFFTRSRAEFFYALRDLWWIDCSLERNNVNVLLCFLKLCPKLQKLYVTIDPSCYNLPGAKRFPEIANGPEKLDELELVKIQGCRDEKNELSLARRLRKLSTNSPEIISKPDGTCLRHLVRVPNLENTGKGSYEFRVVANENHHDKYQDHVHTKL